MVTHQRVLGDSYSMNTNMTEFRWFLKIFVSLCFGLKKPWHWKELYKQVKYQHIPLSDFYFIFSLQYLYNNNSI